MSLIYLDNNATTQCENEVVEAMIPFFKNDYGNPASVHPLGRHSNSACEKARAIIAELFSCSPSEIVFSSGATESNNLVILGVTQGIKSRRKIVTSAIEHKSVLDPCLKLLSKGHEVKQVPVTDDCILDINAAKKIIDEETALVTIQGANNEVGTLQPIKQIAEIAHSMGSFFHCDATQLIGKLPLPTHLEFCDFISFSSHKIYGPKGIGGLVVKDGLSRKYIEPLFYGGGQESGLRPGTLNVPGIIGFGCACRLVMEKLNNDIKDIASLRDRFEADIKQLIPEAVINAQCASRLPNTSSLLIPKVPASMLIANLPQICIGEGSACSSGSYDPSHVLLSMGLTRKDAECTVRISFGRHNDMHEVEESVNSIYSAVDLIKSMLVSD